MTASVGISFYPQATENVDVLLSNADIALGQAKEAGKNTYQIFMQQMAEKVKNSQKMEKNLRQALKNNELYICYQPQVEIKGSRIVGMEALLRWQNPELGLVFPIDFIPLAEKTGLIKPIGEWALNTACVQLKRWQQKNLVYVWLLIYQHVNFKRCIATMPIN
jgi:predicted signal transduction protein with EAL and GGDEF domain